MKLNEYFHKFQCGLYLILDHPMNYKFVVSMSEKLVLKPSVFEHFWLEPCGLFTIE